MRLINTTTYELLEFVERIPNYAILLHTWGKPEDEVKLQEWGTDAARMKPGYQKIRKCCEQALVDGLNWVWADTCCIDKSSSAELSEAINSMFRWYRKSVHCYAHLTDVHSTDINAEEFAQSRYFTRGWTLQELLGPVSVVFYNSGWEYISTKVKGVSRVSQICGIPKDQLIGDYVSSPIHNHLRPKLILGKETWADELYVSVAQKMTWAARRRTTRIEDMAYSLLGLFDINMPLLYGEGEHAFYRLQEAIVTKYLPNDLTIMAWQSEHLRGPEQQRRPEHFHRPKTFELREISYWALDLESSGLLAKTPNQFVHYDIPRLFWPLPDDLPREFPLTPMLINEMVRIELPVLSGIELRARERAGYVPLTGRQLLDLAASLREPIFAVIGLLSESLVLTIPLRPAGGAFSRVGNPVKIALDTVKGIEKWKKLLHIHAERHTFGFG